MTIFTRKAAMTRMLFFLSWILLSPLAMGDPDIRILSGERTTQEIAQAIATRSHWFERAINNCTSQSRTGCDITIELSLAGNAATPSCSVSISSIKPENLAALYCSVAETLSFPRQSAASSFILSFTKQTEMDGLAASSPSPASSPAREISDNSTIRVACAVRTETRIRDAEDIRTCFDANAEKLGFIYQLALRRDPTLAGTLRLRLTIDTDGHVSKMDIVASEISNQDFSEKMMAAVRTFNFGPASAIWQGSHDLNFFPN